MNKWRILEGVHPGYLGKQKDNFIDGLDARYGPENWRWAWMLANGEILDYIRMVYEEFASSYAAHFRIYPETQTWLVNNYDYTYDKDLVSREMAFDPHALYNKPGIVNQIHHVGINLGIEKINGVKYMGEKPLQVREGKPGTLQSYWPEGYFLSPSRIAAIRPDLIPDINIPKGWDYQTGSIEDWYQKSKVIQVID